MKEDLWYKNAVFYELYPRAFYDANGDGYGDLRGVIHKLDYLKELGVDCIWLLPIYPSPLRDDGYDISDYTAIHPHFGKLEDFKALVQETHKRGLRIITDLVLNHTSDQHPWFQAARADPSSPYRDYYVWSDDERKYAGTRIIFVDSQKSNWTWDPVAKQFFWHRFYPTQPDLNYDNPRVQEEMFAVMRFWLDLGVDGFRADAVPYLFEREGTSNENLPETHAFLKQIRSYIDEHYPGRILLCEANQWPADVRAYFGEGDEFQMGFHFPVMPRLFKALRKGDASDLVEILRQTPPIPDDCQWCTFLRNHDELTLEMVSEEDRQWMWHEYAPEPRMRLNQGIRRRLAPLLDNDRRKIELAYALLFALPGSPVLYYGDEIGMGDDVTLDDRNGVRTPMQWTDGPNAGFSAAPSERLYSPVIHTPPYAPAQVNAAHQQAEGTSLFNALRRLIQLRKQHPAFGRGSYSTLECGNPAVFGCLRSWGGQNLLALHNLSGIPQTAHLPSANQTLSITLGAYDYTWLTLPL